MKLYYQDEYGILYHGHALETLKKIKNNTIDLVFADPPFNIGKAYKDRRKNYREWCGEWIAECFRVLKDTGSFYHMTLSRHLEWKMPLMAEHGVFVNLIVWRNVSASHSKRCFWGEYQPIMLYGKTNDYIFNTYAETEDSGMRRWGGYSTEYRGQLKDRWEDIPFVYAGSIQHEEAILMPGTNMKAHPTQMPLDLIRRAIRFSTNKGAVCLDPFIGIGTTGVGARELERKWIGIELEEKYCELTVQRIRRTRSTLFDKCDENFKENKQLQLLFKK